MFDKQSGSHGFRECVCASEWLKSLEGILPAPRNYLLQRTKVNNQAAFCDNQWINIFAEVSIGVDCFMQTRILGVDQQVLGKNTNRSGEKNSLVDHFPQCLGSRSQAGSLLFSTLILFKQKQLPLHVNV